MVLWQVLNLARRLPPEYKPALMPKVQDAESLVNLSHGGFLTSNLKIRIHTYMINLNGALMIKKLGSLKGVCSVLFKQRHMFFLDIQLKG